MQVLFYSGESAEACEEPPSFLPGRHKCREVHEMTEQTEGAEATKQETKDSIPEIKTHKKEKHIWKCVCVYTQ